MTSTRPHLLIIEPAGYSEDALNLLRPAFHIETGPLTRDELKRCLSECDAVLIRLGHRFDADLLAFADKLKAIASPTTGLNHIDTTEAARRDIAVLSLRGETAFLDSVHATAEHSWALLLSLLRQIPAAVMSVNAGRWVRDDFRGRELNGKTLGIIGFGRLGSKVAGYGRAFGMKVIASDPIAGLPSWVEPVNLEQLARQADVVSLHASFDEANRNLVDRAFFFALRDGALFINTARGEIVEEAALLEALESGRLSGAALDVLCDENVPSRESQKLKDYARANSNLIITPHLGGATTESMSKTEVFMARKLLDFFNACESKKG